MSKNVRLLVVWFFIFKILRLHLDKKVKIKDTERWGGSFFTWSVLYSVELSVCLPVSHIPLLRPPEPRAHAPRHFPCLKLFAGSTVGPRHYRVGSLSR